MVAMSKPTTRSLRQSLSIWMTRLSVLTVIAALSLPLVFIVILSNQNERSFVVSAKTSFLSLTFGETQPDWRLPEVLVCEPVDIPRRNAPDACGAAFAPVGSWHELLVSWSSGETVTLASDQDGRLRITALGENSTIPNGGHIVTKQNFWAETGTLLFHAEVTLGQTLASGTRFYLWSGEWQAREAGAANYFFRTRTEIVKEGTLTAGTKAKIQRHDGTTTLSHGHIGQRQTDGLIDISLVTEASDSALSVQYFGVEEPILTQPDWVDVTLKSPVLIAIAAIFPLLASLGLFLTDALHRSEASPQTKTRASKYRRWNIRRTIRSSRRQR